MDLAKRKCAKLSRELEVAGLIYHSHSGSSQNGGVSVVSFKNPPKLPAWQEHISNPQPPPLKIQDYTCPPNAVTPDPEKITWMPYKISGPVTVADACRLYCIEPEDIQDLSQYSCWIDLPTVAKRALTLHGGFYAHKELVRKRRDEEEDALDREIPEADDRQSRFRFSPMIAKQWEERDDDYGWYDTSSGPSKQHRVAAHYPISYICQDDYGCDWVWTPDWEFVNNY
ncbi:hypothetical protein B0H17DRAFT_1034694 [Mycena rosella]|uniref:Uncharacterized protein n=1 Tax=Mycena rosella TaxID=1033263 RepID=A0AAD7GWL1_MYCRO|nr:hypothetical protein B0H17DRAFT_1034694 [Mycena rosella]